MSWASKPKLLASITGLLAIGMAHCSETGKEMAEMNDKPSHPYIGMWVTQDANIRQPPAEQTTARERESETQQ